MNATLTGIFQGLTALGANGLFLEPKTLKFTPRLFGFRLNVKYDRARGTMVAVIKACSIRHAVGTVTV